MRFKYIGGLNAKIISYFTAFAFFPLFVFSILGYYINQDMITRINLDNLHLLNANSVAKVQQYLDFKKSVLKNISIVCSEMSPRIDDEHVSRFFKDHTSLINNEFELIYLYSGGIGTQVWSKYRKPNKIFPRGMMPVISQPLNGSGRLLAYLSVANFQNLIQSDVGHISHEIYLTDQKLKIEDGRVEAFDDLGKMLKHFDEKSYEYPWNLFGSDNEKGLISTYSYAADRSFLLITKIDAKQFYSELDAFRTKIVAANMILAFILIVLAFVSSGRITKINARIMFAATILVRNASNSE